MRARRHLVFADTRFPIERANGLQTMATCHALAARGHDVRLVVRRIPRCRRAIRLTSTAFRANRGCTSTRCPLPATCRRGARSSWSPRSGLVATSRAEVIFTRDLGLAAFLLQVPALRRAPVGLMNRTAFRPSSPPKCRCCWANPSWRRRRARSSASNAASGASGAARKRT